MRIHQPTIATSDGLRATWVEVNLARLSHNLQEIRARVAPSKVMIIVKANAYGHGLGEVARHLSSEADYIGVAVVEEGVYLRELGVEANILVMGGIWGDQIPLYLQNRLTLTASSVERLEQINDIARTMGIKARVHLKIDTGMERIGVQYFNASSLQEKSLKCANIEVEGIYSHFANADSPDLSHALLQLERFSEVIRFYERHDLPTPMRHIANSAAILQIPQSYLDMVRPGILLYGVYPSPDINHGVPVFPALTWKSRVVYFKVVKPGHPVSYGSTWQADHPTRIVTLPVGYGDGYFRNLSNKSQVMIHGKKYPQVGRICMDQMMVDIENDSAYNGDEVILVGEEGQEAISVQNLAEWANTIPYEILTNINTRVPRVYVSEAKV